MHRRRSRTLARAGVAAVLGAGAIAGPAAADDVSAPPVDHADTATYLVLLHHRPAPHDEATRSRLLTGQDRVLTALGGPEVRYRYTAAVDGFAAVLRPDQVTTLRDRDDVVRVERAAVHQVDAAPAGPVRATRAEDLARRGAGHGVVVGVVDTGLWPESPSFAALPKTGQHTGFHGSCEAADHWDPSLCNGKVVGARWFVRGFGADQLSTTDYLSPRDGTGHGTEVAGAAVGNPGVTPVVGHQRFRRISGGAPAARLAVYKACWSAPDPGEDGCNTADLVAAVDAAVADGVDVLNYSVSGTRPGDAVSRAFLGAAEDGVVVVTSAGNRGPAPGTVTASSPWVLTVGATTGKPRTGAVVLGDETSYDGAMVADRGVGRRPLVLAEQAAADGVPARAARLCKEGSLDAGRVEGAVVLCDRGDVPRVNKSQTVQQAGGVAMVLANTVQRGTFPDIHAVPTVHVDRAAGDAVRRYVRSTAHPTASLRSHRTADDNTAPPPPRVAPFSSRGGSAPGGGPDLLAPGVGILGPTAPTTDEGRLWDFASGTSLAAAAVSGAAADVLSDHPTWSPADVRSALISASRESSDPATVLGSGAGAVDPQRAADPGATFDVRGWQYRHLLRGSIDTPRVNTPSVVAPRAGHRTVVRRRLTNRSGEVEAYRADVAGVIGWRVHVTPRIVTLPPHGSRTVRIRLHRARTTQPGRWSTGRITWTGRADTGHLLHVPVAVR